MTTLKFNVAQLLREPVGSRRSYDFSEGLLLIDEDKYLRDICGTVKFTRTATGVYANIDAAGVVNLTCVRSLDDFDYHIQLHFSDQFHSIVDVASGHGLPQPLEDDPFLLSELHMADIGDAIREYALLEIPINPVSEAYRDMPVTYTTQSEDAEPEEDITDARLAALKTWAERQNNGNI